MWTRNLDFTFFDVSDSSYSKKHEINRPRHSWTTNEINLSFSHWSISSLPAVNAEHETRVNEGEEEMEHEADEEELANLVAFEFRLL